MSQGRLKVINLINNSPVNHPIIALQRIHLDTGISNDSEHASFLLKGWGHMFNDQNNFHWIIPIGTVLLFSCGVAIAVGHRLYYSSLHGTNVRDFES